MQRYTFNFKYHDAISEDNSNGCSADYPLKFLALVICLGLLFYAQRKSKPNRTCR